MNKKKKRFELKEIESVFIRRYNYSRSAFEIFLKSGRSYFFNVYNPKTLKSVLAALVEFNKKVTRIKRIKKKRKN